MATLAEMLVSGATQTAQQSGEQLTSGIKTGAALAEQVEQTRIRREQMEQQKEQLQMQKANSVVDTMKIAASSKDKRLKDFLLKKVLPAKVNALGMDKFFTPQTLEMVQTSEDAQKKVLGLQLDLDEKVRSGQMTGGEAYREAQRILTDPEELALLDTDRLFDAQTFKNSEEGKAQRNAQMAGATAARAKDARSEAGEVEESKKIADQKVIWEAGGGEASADKAIGVFQAAIKKLKNNEVKFGTLSKKIPFASSEAMLSRLDPAAKALLDDVRGGINIRLKTGDPNPTQNQIDQIMARAVDPVLGNEANIKKLETEIAAMQKDKENKLRTFYGKGSVSPKTYDIGGRKATAEQAKAFYKANPQFATPELKKELGL